MSETVILGVIGGSGLYDMDGLENIEQHTIKTPFGDPSSPIVIGTLEGTKVAFLARHGIGHIYSPTEVNYRANIYALKSIGVERVVSISACGSLREDFKPGHLVIPDQLFDFTRDRKRTFFEGGFVAHIGVAEPFCNDFSGELFEAVKASKSTIHKGATFITVEGPRFSTRGESNLYRTWGMDLIGMTTSPEAFLAREAELCYGVIAHVTDYDVWHLSEKSVTAAMVFETVKNNMKAAQLAIRNLALGFGITGPCICQSALAEAFSTKESEISPEALKKVSLLVEKYK